MGPDETTQLEEDRGLEERREDEGAEAPPEVLDEVLIEEVGIDGMCGVY